MSLFLVILYIVYSTSNQGVVDWLVNALEDWVLNHTALCIDNQIIWALKRSCIVVGVGTTSPKGLWHEGVQHIEI